MKQKKEIIWLCSLGGVVLVALGIFIGYKILNPGKKSLEGGIYGAVGYATDANWYATGFNATDGNLYATAFNATDCNLYATDPNATGCNATTTNYRQNYNVLLMGAFRLLDANAKVGETVQITLNTEGANLIGATLFFRKTDGSYYFSTPVKAVTGFPYVILPYDIPTGTYYVERIMAVARNYDYTTFNRTFLGDYYTKERIYIENKESSTTLKNISLKQTTGTIGEKVEINVETDKPVSNIKLLFTSISGSAMEVNVKSISSNPYFTVPSTINPGSYKLTRVSLTNKDGIKEYSSDAVDASKKITNDILLEVVENTHETYVYDNDSIANDQNDTILNVFYNAPNNINITINAEMNSLIDESVFNIIKGTDKKVIIVYNDNEMVFDGENIETPKSIDANIEVKSAEENAKIKKIVDNGVIISFSDNGNLPGKANVRIKENELLNNILGNNKIYVYLYNEEDNNFTEVETVVSKSDDGYYEFVIDHNSDYLLVTKKIESEYIAKDTNVVSFQRGDRTNLVLIIIGAILIVGTTVAIIVIKKKSNPQISTKNNE